MTGLTEFQKDVLQRFFRHRREFFLTGGAALAGFYLDHRTTHDLDLFTTLDVLEEGERTVREIALELGAEVSSLQRSPTFRRLMLSSSSEGLVIDLVLDQAPQIDEKRRFGEVVVDSPLEIFANKLCTILSRFEPRDLFDVLKLEASGLDLAEACSMAARKDGGFSPMQLAWVLSRFPLRTADLPEEWPAEEMAIYRDDLVRRLSIAGFPQT